MAALDLQRSFETDASVQNALKAIDRLRNDADMTEAEKAFLLDQISDVVDHLVDANQTLVAELYTDPVTGGHNRKAMMRFLDSVLERMENDTALKYEIVFLDLDGFKQVNDACGHEDGDVVLIEADVRFSDALQENDMVARLGGDEIVILLEHKPERNLSHAEIKFKTGRILAGMGIWNFANEQETYHPIGASVGQHTLSHDEMIRVGKTAYASFVLGKADEAMYMDKVEKALRLAREGKNAQQALKFQQELVA